LRILPRSRNFTIIYTFIYSDKLCLGTKIRKVSGGFITRQNQKISEAQAGVWLQTYREIVNIVSFELWPETSWTVNSKETDKLLNMLILHVR